MMVPDAQYFYAWLTLLLFRPESCIYETAWETVHVLEDSRAYCPGELRMLRTQARRHYEAALAQA